MTLLELREKINKLEQEKNNRKTEITDKIKSLQLELEGLESEDLYRQLTLAKTLNAEEDINSKLDRIDAIKKTMNRLKKASEVDEKITLDVADFNTVAESIDCTELENLNIEYEKLVNNMINLFDRCIETNKKYRNQIEELYGLAEVYMGTKHVESIKNIHSVFAEKCIKNVSLRTINFDDINNKLSASGWVSI